MRAPSLHQNSFPGSRFFAAPSSGAFCNYLMLIVIAKAFISIVDGLEMASHEFQSTSCDLDFDKDEGCHLTLTVSLE